MFSLTISAAGSFTGPLADPDGSSALIAAVSWLQNTLLGTLATSIAVIAVATVGLMMLSGRMNVRYGATVIVGCFILFGASSIAAGIRSTASNAGISDDRAIVPIEQFSAPDLIRPPPPAPLTPSAGNADPYAGASVPDRR